MSPDSPPRAGTSRAPTSTNPRSDRSKARPSAYKGLCDYYDISEATRAAWSYHNAYREVDKINEMVSFEADKVEVYLDGRRLHPEPGRTSSHTVSTATWTSARSMPTDAWSSSRNRWGRPVRSLGAG